MLVGKNSVGKTSLLEAVNLFAAEGSPRVMREVLEKRGELSLSGVPDVDDELPHLEPLAYDSLFFGRPDLRAENGRFEIKARIGGAERPVSLNVASCQIATEVEKTEDGVSIKEFIVSDGSAFDSDSDIAYGLKIEYEEKERLVKSGSIENFRTRIPPMFRDFYARSRAQYVSSNGLSDFAVSSFWDSITLTEKEKIVYDALRLVISDIERIAFVGDVRGPRARFPVAKLGRHERPVPIRSLGEGVSHLLSISLALVSARGRYLLIDEVENGIHYSVMKDLWQLILQQSEELNVQVLATTHSYDCIKGFQQAVEGLDPSVAHLIRLEGKDGNIKGVPFDPEELEIAESQEIEIR